MEMLASKSKTRAVSLDDIRFMVLWVVTSIIGFIAGSFLGATDGGLFTANGGLVFLVLGDLVFGAVFGFTQWLVFSRYFPDIELRSLLWVLASSVGFMIGVRAATRLTYMVATEGILVGITFGIIVGICIGIAQWFALRQMFPNRNTLIWVPTAILAWICGETVAFAFNWHQNGVPFVGMVIGIITGIVLLWLKR